MLLTALLVPGLLVVSACGADDPKPAAATAPVAPTDAKAEPTTSAAPAPAPASLGADFCTDLPQSVAEAAFGAAVTSGPALAPEKGCRFAIGQNGSPGYEKIELTGNTLLGLNTTKKLLTPGTELTVGGRPGWLSHGMGSNQITVALSTDPEKTGYLTADFFFVDKNGSADEARGVQVSTKLLEKLLTKYQR
ncbi:hypothetical protein F4556_001170 [Kitasatospora gansuensis]|uniref:DUF3558 domain-containing protein n=1 Tax=Kitasatospora gansuensis TaxID=258050 RepID=A0A7W7S851_9ACTN|nr:DUF3558 family protein [Kitasatospora gansuensis]MBB4945635.1 hypothetical protein [Kitasatospora gansuensis]